MWIRFRNLATGQLISVPALILIASLSLFWGCAKENDCEPEGTSGRLLVAIMENGQRMTEYRYDNHDLLVQRDNYFNDSLINSESYTYDSSHKLISASFDGFIEKYQYASGGKLLAVIRTYNPTDKEWKTVYHYDGSRISRGVTYFNGTETGYVIFKYDSNGNTIERTEYLYLDGREDFMNSQLKYHYDDKINPLRNHQIPPIDLVRNNNPTYYYYYLSIMSSFPPEYNATFEYDEKGYPVSEKRNFRTFDYIYSDTSR